jgi:hypothetical protein
LDLNVAGLEVKDLHLDSARWSTERAVASSIIVALPEKFYTLNVNTISYSSAEKNLTVDSFKVIPDFDRAAFMRKSKYQTDRIDLLVPKLSVSGINIISQNNKPFIHVQYINMNMWAEVFRDKRYPFNNNDKMLPARFIQSVAIPFQIDSFKLTGSYVSYEEFQEGGVKPGKVFFDKLNSSIYNISNSSKEETRMEATAWLMDAGLLHAKFTFPGDPDKPYTASGAITNFPLKEVNLMLTPVANAEIQSGTLEEMKFHFIYNDTRSDGELELNYKNLKMISFKKDRKETNRFVTFLLRLFVKKDLDEKMSTDKKTGTILFYRDKKRSLFNYWWKSILSGIKSVYDIDKITDTDGKK